MDQAVYDLGRDQYRRMVGYDDMPRDKDGFVVLKPTADRVDRKVESLTTNIDDLEAKLKAFREEKQAAEKYKKTPEYKESKKKSKGNKKAKKARTTLLEMVFNNADAVMETDDDGENEEGYRDTKKKGAKKTGNTLDTTYGKRFSPVVSMLHDTITDFDKIAAEIEEELQSSRGQTRNMYRSNQISNLISAKNSKLSAVKELGSIAKTVSDLEYKKDKDKKAEEGADTAKAISSLGAKYLRGAFDMDDNKGGKSKKGKNKEKTEGNFKRSARSLDDDDDDMSVKRGGDSKGTPDDVELAKEFAKALTGRSDKMSFTPHERFIAMEGKYSFIVTVDPTDPENTWQFVAVDPKSGKKIDGFKKDYKELMPRKKDCRMRFDIAKKKCTDLNSSRTYKLVFTD